MTNYSIIIPHFEIPELLKRCLDSIPQRDDTEVIVVDDCSSAKYQPRIHEICKNAGNNVHLMVQKANQGGGVARNTALEVAQGSFVIFADADDFFTDNVNKILDAYAHDKEHDIIFFYGKSVDCDTLEPTNRLDYINQKLDLWKRDKEEGEVQLRYNFDCPVCKIIRRNIIEHNRIRFDATRIHNDTTFAYTVGYHAKTIIVDNRALYVATTRENSVSHQKGASFALATIGVVSRKVKFLQEHKIKNVVDDILAYNIYMLLRQRDFDTFKKAFEVTRDSGLSENETEHILVHEIAKYSPMACAYLAVMSKKASIVTSCIKELFKTSIPQLFKK